jgi:HK97 family phage major capsid protein
MKLHQKLKALIEELKALGAKAEWTAEDEAEEARIKAAIDETKAAIAREQKRAAVKNEVAQLDEFLNEPGDTNLPVPDEAHSGDKAQNGQAGKGEGADNIEVVSRARVKNFKSAKSAYGFGMFLMAGLHGDAKAREYCKRNGIEVKAQVESRNESGGLLVPIQYDNEMIDLREDYGIARRLLRNTPMTSDTLERKRRKGGLTAYPVGERGAATASMKGWDDVTLNARRWAIMALMSSEWSEDSVINEADDLAGEMAYSFAQKEDDCAFNGDGTSAYHRIVGLGPALKSLSGTVANIAGLQVASGNAWSEITKTDLTNLMARLPAYAHARGPRWFCSSAFYFSVIERLIDEAGGNSRVDVVNGKATYFYKGLPVEMSQSLPLVESNSSIPLYLGVPQLAGMFGDRRGITIAQTTEATIGDESMFETESAAIRATERFDINWHDLGNASGTAANRVAGPIVGLIMAAS